MKIPNDPIMLYSFLNMRLRDSGVTLSELCKELCISQSEVTNKLSVVGFSYDETTNQFK